MDKVIDRVIQLTVRQCGRNRGYWLMLESYPVLHNSTISLR